MSKDDLRRAFSNFSSGKVNKHLQVSGLLGTIKDGEEIVSVEGRIGYVWVRLRNSSAEVVQAYNDTVSPVYNLPVLIERDPNNPNRFRIANRDIGRYDSWGSASSFLSAHGNQHSLGATGGGGDIVWVYPGQFLSLSAYPSGSAGAGVVIIAPHAYSYNSRWYYVGNTGTPSILSLAPTATGTSRMVLVYLEKESGNFGLVQGSDFNAGISGTSALFTFVPVPSGTQVPIAAIRLDTGTSSIQWDRIYDTRPFYF